jgi:hypothetical protein
MFDGLLPSMPGAPPDEQIRKLQNELTTARIDLGVALGAAQLAVGHLDDSETKTRVGDLLGQVAARQAGALGGDTLIPPLVLEEACGLLRRAADAVTFYEVEEGYKDVPGGDERLLPDIGAFLARVAPG